MKRISVQYFAILREQAGVSEEQIETSADSPAALYRELAGRHRFTLAYSQMKVAVNDDFAPWDWPMRDGDRVVFIPPVAGG